MGNECTIENEELIAVLQKKTWKWLWMTTLTLIPAAKRTFHFHLPCIRYVCKILVIITPLLLVVEKTDNSVTSSGHQMLQMILKCAGRKKKKKEEDSKHCCKHGIVSIAWERKSARTEIRGNMLKVFKYTRTTEFHVLCKKNKKKLGTICSSLSYRIPCMRMVTLIDKVCSRLSFTG